MKELNNLLLTIDSHLAQLKQNQDFQLSVLSVYPELVPLPTRIANEYAFMMLTELKELLTIYKFSLDQQSNGRLLEEKKTQFFDMLEEFLKSNWQLINNTTILTSLAKSNIVSLLCRIANDISAFRNHNDKSKSLAYLSPGTLPESLSDQVESTAYGVPEFSACASLQEFLGKHLYINRTYLPVWLIAKWQDDKILNIYDETEYSATQCAKTYEETLKRLSHHSQITQELYQAKNAYHEHINQTPHLLGQLQTLANHLDYSSSLGVGHEFKAHEEAEIAIRRFLDYYENQLSTVQKDGLPIEVKVEIIKLNNLIGIYSPPFLSYSQEDSTDEEDSVDEKVLFSPDFVKIPEFSTCVNLRFRQITKLIKAYGASLAVGADHSAAETAAKNLENHVITQMDNFCELYRSKHFLGSDRLLVTMDFCSSIGVEIKATRFRDIIDIFLLFNANELKTLFADKHQRDSPKTIENIENLVALCKLIPNDKLTVLFEIIDRHFLSTIVTSTKKFLIVLSTLPLEKIEIICRSNRQELLHQLVLNIEDLRLLNSHDQQQTRVIMHHLETEIMTMSCDDFIILMTTPFLLSSIEGLSSAGSSEASEFIKFFINKTRAIAVSAHQQEVYTLLINMLISELINENDTTKILLCILAYHLSSTALEADQLNYLLIRDGALTSPFDLMLSITSKLLTKDGSDELDNHSLQRPISLKLLFSNITELNDDRTHTADLFLQAVSGFQLHYLFSRALNSLFAVIASSLKRHLPDSIPLMATWVTCRGGTAPTLALIFRAISSRNTAVEGIYSIFSRHVPLSATQSIAMMKIFNGLEHTQKAYVLHILHHQYNSTGAPPQQTSRITSLQRLTGRTDFANTEFDCLNLSRFDLQGLDFSNASLRGAILDSSDISRMILTGDISTDTNTSFKGAITFKTKLDTKSFCLLHPHFSANGFYRMDLTSVDFNCLRLIAKGHSTQSVFNFKKIYIHPQQVKQIKNLVRHGLIAKASVVQRTPVRNKSGYWLLDYMLHGKSEERLVKITPSTTVVSRSTSLTENKNLTITA